VEVVERVHADGRLLRVVINQRDETVSIPLPAGARRDLLADRALPAGAPLELEPNGVALLA
jgi:hypothetical protein